MLFGFKHEKDTLKKKIPIRFDIALKRNKSLMLKNPTTQHEFLTFNILLHTKITPQLIHKYLVFLIKTKDSRRFCTF